MSNRMAHGGVVRNGVRCGGTRTSNSDFALAFVRPSAISGPEYPPSFSRPGAYSRERRGIGQTGRRSGLQMNVGESTWKHHQTIHS
jgi:hypothetical protein